MMMMMMMMTQATSRRRSHFINGTITPRPLDELID